MAESNDIDSAPSAPSAPAGADASGNAGDKLVLHDVLADEHDPCNVSSNLHFRYDAVNGVTTVEVTGTSSAPQSIVLQGADLTSGGSLSDTQIIQLLLAQGTPTTGV